VTASGVLDPVGRADVKLALDPASRLAGVALSGRAAGVITRGAVSNVAIALAAGAAKLSVAGSAGSASDVLEMALDAPSLAELVPLLPPAVPHTLSGGLKVSATWRGALWEGEAQAHAHADALKIGRAHSVRTLDVDFALAASPGGAAGADLAARSIRVDARAVDFVAPPGTFESARVRVEGTLARHAASVAFTSAEMAVAAAAHGGFTQTALAATGSAWSWSGTVDTLEGRGPLALRLAAPATVAYSHGRVQVGAVRLAIADGTMQVAEFTWEEGRITTSGHFSAVPLATAARIAGVALPVGSTLTLGGEWSLAATPRLNGSATIRRESGDLQLPASAAAGTPANLALGITSLEVTARFADDTIDATARYASTRGGRASATMTIGAAPGAPPGRILAAAPVTLHAQAQLATLALLQPWVGTTAVVDGQARAEITGRGTLGAITLAGTLDADAIRVDAPQYGVYFKDGRLAVHFAEGNVVVDEFVLAAGTGKFRASGAVTAATAADAATSARINWHATKFRLLNRPDLNLVVDGDGTLALANAKLALAGKLKADEGHIVYASDPSARLGDDVVVKGWPPRAEPALRASELPLGIDVALDFGDRLTFAGEGLETRLSGTLRVTTGARGLLGKGSIRAVNGTYRAFGQKLVIDPGRLIFDGPLDNPGLDIVALRKNLTVEAGVAVTGTVKVPIIALTSNPPVPDSEKLAWLVLGHGLDRTSGADFAALQTASALLLGRNAKPVTATIAESVGVDDISIKSGGPTARGAHNGASDAENRVIAIGKRLSDKLSLVYEQGLTVANSALKIEYSLTRNITLRAETGVVSGVGIQYNRSFE
jgi:translocation and assembly module TamB